MSLNPFTRKACFDFPSSIWKNRLIVTSNIFWLYIQAIYNTTLTFHPDVIAKQQTTNWSLWRKIYFYNLTKSENIGKLFIFIHLWHSLIRLEQKYGEINWNTRIMNFFETISYKRPRDWETSLHQYIRPTHRRNPRITFQSKSEVFNRMNLKNLWTH
jgi:hypothetical protein